MKNKLKIFGVRVMLKVLLKLDDSLFLILGGSTTICAIGNHHVQILW
jgi:hypothetical protein